MGGQSDGGTKTTAPLIGDLLAPEMIRDPYDALATLRDADPVHWSDTHRAWLVTRYDDVSAAFLRPELSSNRVTPLLASLTDTRRAQIGAVMEMMAGWMVVTDPPEHTRLRRLAARAFNPERVARLEDQMKATLDRYLDQFIASGGTDLVSGFAYPLPATVIAQVLGAPEEDYMRFQEWSKALATVAFGAGGDERASRHETAMRGLQDMLAYIGELIELARSRPARADMISGLLEGDGSGEVLTDDEISAMCALMLFAGHETTATLISTAVVRLLQTPDQLSLLKSDPSLAPLAVEEMLRYEGPIKVLIRWVTEDVEIRGREVKAGDRVFLLLGAANRDPARFVDPDRIDITRRPNAHLGFGRGVHACIGAQVSRLETRIALSTLFARLPDLRLAEQELEWTSSLASRGLKTARVEYDMVVR